MEDLPYDADRPDVWTWLQSWYVAQCDGDWEHEFGIKIDTIDNPGWRVEIDLPAPITFYGGRDVHRSEDDWCVAKVEGDKFRAACGPINLGEALQEFRTAANRGTTG